jgi:hypothetical protein
MNGLPFGLFYFLTGFWSKMGIVGVACGMWEWLVETCGMWEWQVEIAGMWEWLVEAPSTGRGVVM